MKHKLSITLTLLGMFLITQFIGIYVVNAYTPIQELIIDPSTGEKTIFLQENKIPFSSQKGEEPISITEIILAFALAFLIIFALMKYKLKFVIRTWFFFVVFFGLTITIYAVLKNYPIPAEYIAIAISIPLAYFKIFKPHILIHNLTELMVYPGIAAVFVSILTVKAILVILVLLSIYDMWAVCKSGIMQKMAKFQMEELRIFGGFLIPSASKRVKAQIKKIKLKYKNKKMPKKIENKKFKINIAILGGGDVVFPIITAGVFMRAYDLTSALFIIFGALAGLTWLFIITKKGKAYPAMPYITAGIFAGLILWKIFF